MPSKPPGSKPWARARACRCGPPCFAGPHARRDNPPWWQFDAAEASGAAAEAEAEAPTPSTVGAPIPPPKTNTPRTLQAFQPGAGAVAGGRSREREP